MKHYASCCSTHDVPAIAFKRKSRIGRVSLKPKNNGISLSDILRYRKYNFIQFAHTMLVKPGTRKKFYMLVDWIACNLGLLYLIPVRNQLVLRALI